MREIFSLLRVYGSDGETIASASCSIPLKKGQCEVCAAHLLLSGEDMEKLPTKGHLPRAIWHDKHMARAKELARKSAKAVK